MALNQNKRMLTNVLSRVVNRKKKVKQKMRKKYDPTMTLQKRYYLFPSQTRSTTWTVVSEGMKGFAPADGPPPNYTPPHSTRPPQGTPT